MIKTANSKFWPASQEDEEKLKKLKSADVYEVNIKANQNYELHKKTMGFFAFCCDFYYGDSEAHKDEYKFDHVRKKLTVIAGYYHQVWDRDGVNFELVPMSLKYEKMAAEERGIFYKRVTDAALKRVFDRTTDQNVINQLLGFF